MAAWDGRFEPSASHPDRLVSHVRLRVADGGGHDELPHAAFRHAGEALLHRWDHQVRLLAEDEAEVVLLVALDLAQLLGLERPTEVADLPHTATALASGGIGFELGQNSGSAGAPR
eukprot:scaffold90398_cov57-Phaeocystis_antarctica.AAC.4